MYFIVEQLGEKDAIVGAIEFRSQREDILG